MKPRLEFGGLIVVFIRFLPIMIVYSTIRYSTEKAKAGPFMSREDAIELELSVLAEDATEEEVDEMTRNLLRELRETQVESANLVSAGAAPEGSKGDPITIGTIALEVLPAAVPGLIAFVQAWVMRGQGRTVKFKGKGIEFEGPPEELEKLLKSLDKRGKK
ncbi:MAG: hypothetical protein EDM79_19310 [Chloroflexi bacterium]|nr:MAG: hypothetical protein EDM79_19310 [Chloroflexota bacterium]